MAAGRVYHCPQWKAPLEQIQADALTAQVWQPPWGGPARGRAPSVEVAPPEQGVWLPLPGPRGQEQPAQRLASILRENWL